jgi:DNA-directed RNA polymerase specialized sigma24 family protein
VPVRAAEPVGGDAAAPHPRPRRRTGHRGRGGPRSRPRRAILDLPPISRLVVVLFFFMDLPLEEVARIAGISTSAARGRLYRSIRRLRPGLEPEEELR